MLRTSCSFFRAVSTGLEAQACSARFLSTSLPQCFSPSDSALGRGDRKTKRGKRFAASSGAYKPKQEDVRRARLKFMDPTGLRRMALPHIACLDSYRQLEEPDSAQEPVFFEEEYELSEDSGPGESEGSEHSGSGKLESANASIS